MRLRLPALLLVIALLALLGGSAAWLVSRAGETADRGAETPVATHAAVAPGNPAADAAVAPRARVGDREPTSAAASTADTEPAAGAAPTPDTGLSPDTLTRARALAGAAIEAIRDDVHREKMRLVWPDDPPSPPADGAEMTIIRGYMSYSLAHIEWRSGVASGLGLEAKRSWFYNAKGESHACRAFIVAPEDFVATWVAAQMVRGVTAERIEPLPEGQMLGHSGGGSSHEPYLWVRLSDATLGSHAAQEHGHSGSSDGVRDWSEIRDRALHELVRALDDRDHATATPMAAWKPFADRTLAAFAASLDLDWRSPDRLLLELVLRAAGEVGDAETLESIAQIEAHVATLDQTEYAVEVATRNLQSAAARITLRLAWSPSAAADLIHGTERKTYADSDLVKWTRALFRERDPDAYLSLLLADLAVPAAAEDTISELEAHFPERAREALAELLASEDPKTRAAAALTLVRLGDAPRAAPALEALAADTTLRDPTWDLSPDGARMTVIRHLLESGAWDAVRVREQLAAPGEDGHVVALLVAHLAKTGDPLTAIESRDAYRPVLGGPLDGGLLAACQALVDLDDRPSFPKMRERLAEMAAVAAGAGGDAIGRWHRERTIPELREALGE